MSRRAFGKWLLGILGVFLTAGCRSRRDGNEQEEEQTTGRSHRLTLVEPGEPGQPMVLRGRIFASDGETPWPGAKLHVYHTDAEGMYSRPTSDPRRARIAGTVWTNGDGEYELTTILPGSYPDTTASAHIHVHLQAGDMPLHWVDSFLFAGDPYLGDRELRANLGQGSFSAVVDLTEMDGTLHGSRDFRLDPKVAEEQRLVDGWYRD